jgi:phage terminase large subunit-like protein
VPDNFSFAEKVALLSPAEREAFYSELTPEDAAGLDYDWAFWRRPDQTEPLHPTLGEKWASWLILAGRGFGKTRTGAETIRARMCGSTPLAGGRWRHAALIAETAADARDVMVADGKEGSESSGILPVHPPDFRPTYEPSKRRLTWPNGATATIFNATEPDQLRGGQFDGAWADELCKWRYAKDTWDNLQFCLRTGELPQVVITTTPKPILLLKEILTDPTTVVTRGSTLANRANLAPRFLATVLRKYAGTRTGRQEINAEVLEELQGALWRRPVLDALRVKERDLPPLKRIVVAVDPAMSSNDDSNETGIVVAGLGEDGHGYVLDDVSGIFSPDEWAREAISLYWTRAADRVVGEVNNGGEMIENTLRIVDPNVSYRAVWATKGKFIRAEPISALYEQGRVHHVGTFAQLEDQMCSFTPDFDRKTAGYSPDRMDALVWALTELMVDAQESRLLFG